jgi:hypothetical protein
MTRNASAPSDRSGAGISASRRRRPRQVNGIGNRQVIARSCTMSFVFARARRWIFVLAALGFASVIPRDRVAAQDPAHPSPEELERARRLEEMKEIVLAFQISAIDEKGQRTPATITPEPLHRWTDPTREFSGGALWAWRCSGRPAAIIALELYGKAWSYEFVSLSTGRLTADHGHFHWAPSRAGVAFHEIPDAPAPAADEAGRLRQLKELARRFSAREFWSGRYYTLRLLPHPIDRYADAASGLVDGAIFTYANGTNPEILFLVEARRQGDARPKWSYAAAPLGRAALYLSLGTQDVWTSPSKADVVFKPEDPYFIGLTPRRSSDRNQPGEQ